MKKTVSFSIDEDVKEWIDRNKVINFSELVNEFLIKCKRKLDERNYDLKELVL